MGVLPLQFPDGDDAQSLGLTGEEIFAIEGLAEAMNGGGAPPREVRVSAQPASGEPIRFDARVRIDTPREADYFRHGGILQYVLRALVARAPALDSDGDSSSGSASPRQTSA